MLARLTTAATPSESTFTVSCQSSTTPEPADSNEERCRAGNSSASNCVLSASRMVSVEALLLKPREAAARAESVDLPTPLLPVMTRSRGLLICSPQRWIDLISRYSSRPWTPSSRPLPESL